MQAAPAHAERASLYKNTSTYIVKGTVVPFFAYINNFSI